MSKIKKGQVVVCIDEDRANEDFGYSGIVFKGRGDLVLGKEYEVEGVVTNTALWGSLYQIKLKGIERSAWAHHFRIKKLFWP